LRYRVVTEEERDTYDDFVADGPRGHALQSWEWGEVKRATGWVPYRVLVEDGGRPRAAVSILSRRLPIPGKSVLYAPRGPVVDPLDDEALDALVEGAREVASRTGGILVKVDPAWDEGDREARGALERRGFLLVNAAVNFEGVQPRFVFRLRIDRPEDELLRAMASKTRYNIRLASRRGVRVRPAERRDLPAFYDLLLVTARRDGFTVRSRSYFETIWDHMVERGLARFFLAEHEGALIAASLAFRFGPTVWYMYGASANRHRNLMPNHLLQWEMIRWARSLGCTLYDFRGVSGDTDPENPLYGLYRFKKGFGGRFTAFVGEFDLVLDRAAYLLWRRAEPIVHRALSWVGGLRRPSGGDDE